MGTNSIKNNLAYGFNNGLQSLAPQPVIAKRNPSANDYAEIGTLWINTVSDAYYVLTSSGTWTATSGGAESLTSLTITGASGTVLNVSTGNTTLGGTLIVTGKLTANGGFSPLSTKVTAAAFSATNNATVGTVTLTGQTLAANATQAITISNNLVTTTSAVLVSISNLNVSTNGAYLTIQGIIQAAGSFIIEVKNNSGATLATTDTIIIGFQVLS
jgi:hypothetical protein